MLGPVEQIIKALLRRTQRIGVDDLYMCHRLLWSEPKTRHKILTILEGSCYQQRNLLRFANGSSSPETAGTANARVKIQSVVQRNNTQKATTTNATSSCAQLRSTTTDLFPTSSTNCCNRSIEMFPSGKMNEVTMTCEAPHSR